MMIEAREVRGRHRPHGLQLTPTSGVALGLVVSTLFWAALIEIVRLSGLF
jgi:hypothetical protein